MQDPILKLIPSHLRKKTWHVFLLSGIFYISIALLLGWSVSTYYARKGLIFCPIYEWRELVTNLVAFVIVIPTFWATFVWQSQAIPSLFASLVKREIVRGEEEDIEEFLRRHLYTPANDKRNLYVVIGGIAVSLLLFGISIPPDDPFLWGYPTIWWRVNKIVFAIWLLNGAILMYPVWWVVLRDIYFLRALRMFYRKFELRPKILHPDGCNGLCEIGNYAMKVTGIVIVIGGWVAYLIIFPFWAGKPGWNTNNIGADTIAMMVAYLILAPLSFGSPIWETHKAMADAKKKKLQEIAERIRQIIERRNITVQTEEELRLLYERYSFLEKNCKTWPLKMAVISKFSFSALLPLLSTFFSVWAEWSRS